MVEQVVQLLARKLLAGEEVARHLGIKDVCPPVLRPPFDGRELTAGGIGRPPSQSTACSATRFAVDARAVSHGHRLPVGALLTWVVHAGDGGGCVGLASSTRCTSWFFCAGWLAEWNPGPHCLRAGRLNAHPRSFRLVGSARPENRPHPDAAVGSVAGSSGCGSRTQSTATSPPPKIRRRPRTIAVVAARDTERRPARACGWLVDVPLVLGGYLTCAWPEPPYALTLSHAELGLTGVVDGRAIHHLLVRWPGRSRGSPQPLAAAAPRRSLSEWPSLAASDHVPVVATSARGSLPTTDRGE